MAKTLLLTTLLMMLTWNVMTVTGSKLGVDDAFDGKVAGPA